VALCSSNPSSGPEHRLDLANGVWIITEIEETDMSSHREAPEISKDPVADSTDVYAFVSPDNPGTVTLIANYIPLESPAGGPNFFEFGNDVLYTINIDNDGDGQAEVSYHFRFTTTVTNPHTFLYNTGPIKSLTDPNWNRRQTYSVTRIEEGEDGRLLASGLRCPPCNIGPRSTPMYEKLAAAAVTHLKTGETVFAGQRAEGFYVDLGSIFDLGDLRPFQNLHLLPSPKADGVDPLKNVNVHTIAIQVPISRLTRDGSTPTHVSDPRAVIGVWTAAYRQKVSIAGRDDVGPWTQVSRLGSPLFNEVIVPMSAKDRWNSLPPSADSQFAQYVTHPELAGLLPVLYPNGVFPNLAAYAKPRADLEAIFLTGIPSGIIGGFQNFGGGAALAEELRLNVAVLPSHSPSIFGILGGDLAGFPNGRRVQDDVVAIELRAVAGATIPLVDPSFTPDGAALLVTDGTPPHTYLPTFPYLNTPYDGFDHPSV
jgi:hypothetical protein